MKFRPFMTKRKKTLALLMAAVILAASVPAYTLVYAENENQEIIPSGNQEISPSNESGYDADGIKTVTDETTGETTTYYEPADKNESGVYEITNAGQLAWFAALVNGDTSRIEDGSITQDTSADAVLMSDIDLSTVCSSGLGTWKPIGTGTNVSYNGTFDGNSYTVSNLYINAEYNSKALFGTCAGAAIKNLTVTGEVTVTGKVNVYNVAGIVAKDTGSTITNCTNKVNVTASTTGSNKKAMYIGGVVGYETGEATIENCANAGNISGTIYVGGIVGKMSYSAVLTVKNCYNTGTVTGTCNGGILGYTYSASETATGSAEIKNCYSSVSGLKLTSGTKSVTAENCYYINKTELDSLNGTTAKTEDEFKSGEVAYLLGENNSGVWYQNIDTDTLPVLTGDEDSVVFKVTIKDYAGKNEDEYIYQNKGTLAVSSAAYYSSGYNLKENGTIYANVSSVTISADTAVTVIPAVSYTVTIPEDVASTAFELDEKGENYTASVGDVSVKANWLRGNEKTLSVTIESENGGNLKDASQNVKVPYTWTFRESTIYNEDSGNALSEEEILEDDDGNEILPTFSDTGKTVTLNYKETASTNGDDIKKLMTDGKITVKASDLIYAGNYSDKLTFKIALN